MLMKSPTLVTLLRQPISSRLKVVTPLEIVASRDRVFGYVVTVKV